MRQTDRAIFRCGGPDVIAGNTESPLLSLLFGNYGTVLLTARLCGVTVILGFRFSYCPALSLSIHSFLCNVFFFSRQSFYYTLLYFFLYVLFLFLLSNYCFFTSVFLDSLRFCVVIPSALNKTITAQRRFHTTKKPQLHVSASHISGHEAIE